MGKGRKERGREGRKKQGSEGVREGKDEREGWREERG